MPAVSGASAWALLDADLAQQTGHKLRLAIPETAVFSSGVLQSWLHSSNKTGVLSSVPRCQHSIAALQQRLTAPHVAYEAANPEGWVAVAHFSDGLSWLVDAAGLQSLLSQVYVGAAPTDDAEGASCSSSATEGRELQLLQAYVTPSNDERFVTTFGRVEGSTTTTQIRSYSQRYQGVASAQAAQAKALAVLQQAHAAAAVTSAGHGLSARHGSSCAGSTASLSVGLEAAGEQGAAAGYSSTDDSLRLSGQADSSGRGSCSSVGLCGEVGGRCGVAPLGVHTAAANILYVSGPCSAACETPRLGQTAAEAEAAWQCCETGKQEAELCSSGTSTEQPFHGSSSSCGTGAACRGSEAAVQAAPGRVSKAAAAAVQVLISYLDKALGLRVQGLVAEFIQTTSAATQEQQLLLVGLPHVSFDPQQSRGDTATFTERWGEFLAGAGPPPAPAPAQHSSFCKTPGAFPASSQHTPAHAAHHQPPAACAGSSMQGSPAQQQQQHAFSSANGSCRQQHGQHSQHRGAGFSNGGSMQQLSRQQVNRQFFPALLGGLQPHCGRPGSPDCLHGNSKVQVPARPLSAPRHSAAGARPASPLHNTRPATASPGRMRAGSGAGAGAGSSSAGSIFPSSRPGAGGNPVLRSGSGSGSDACRLWLQAPRRPTDSLTAQLAAQVEASREQLQQYAQAADAATLTAQCALSEAAQQVSAVQQELLQLREDAAAAGHERRQFQQQVSTLQRQHAEQGGLMAGLQQQLAQVQEQLAQDRATLATMMRQHQEREQQLQEELALTQQQNAELRVGAAQLSSRLEEEGEVVAALRAQLVEYKLLYGQMQLQAKKGRTLHTTSSSMFRGGNRPGSATPPGQLQLQGAGSAGYAGGGVAGVLAMQGLAAGAAAADGGGIGILNRSASFLNAQLLQGMSPGAAGVVADGPGGRGHQPQHRSPRVSSSDWQCSALQMAAAARRGQPSTSTAAAGISSSSGAGVRAAVRQQSAGGPTGSSRPGSSSGTGSATSSNRSTTENCAVAAVPGPAGSSCQVLQIGTQSLGSGAATPFLIQQRQQLVGAPGQAVLDVLPRSSSAVQQRGSGSMLSSTPAVQRQTQAVHQAPAAAAATRGPSAQALVAGGNSPSGTAAERTTADAGATSSGSASAAVVNDCDGTSGAQQASRQQQAASKAAAAAAAAGGSSPEVVAVMVSDIASGLGSPLAGAAAEDPILLIGDMLVDPAGYLEPTAPQQLAVLAGLLRAVAGDLAEVYGYYATLGQSLVVGDRMTMELLQFGKLAYDLHVPQDLTTLSAVEDVFYALSDRKPCGELLRRSAAPARSGPTGSSCAKPHKPQATSSSSSSSTKHAGGAGSSSAGKQAVGGAGGSGQSSRSSSSSHREGEAGDREDGAGLQPDLIVAEQFPEALVRLACVRYRYGAVYWEYDWSDDSSDDGEDYVSSIYTDSGTGGSSSGSGVPLSPRSARIRQQQMQVEEAKFSRGPRVLKPEGAALLRPASPARAAAGGGGQHSQHSSYGQFSGSGGQGGGSRSPSPTRPIPEPYPLPNEGDDLVAVVRTFLQQEVLKYGRRCKLAGSSLGIRRARDKPPAWQGWQSLPPGSGLY